MKRIIIPALLLIFVVAGCQRLEAGGSVTRTHYTEREEGADRSNTGRSYISTRAELETAMNNMVISGWGQKTYEDTLTTKGYDGDPLADANEIYETMRATDPQCAYGVANITIKENGSILNVTEIWVSVAYHEDRNIPGMIRALNMDDLESRIRAMFQEFGEQGVFRIGNFQDTPELFQDRLDKCWANQRGGATTGPEQLTWEVYPEGGTDVILEITASYKEENAVLEEKSAEAAREAARIAATFTGQTGEEKIDFIFAYLNTYVQPDVQAVRVQAAEYAQLEKQGPYTAYGALCGGQAAQSGYALGAKALCDAMDVEAQVIVGSYEGYEYYWLWVEYDGQHMHFDLTPDIYELVEDEQTGSEEGPATSGGPYDEDENMEEHIWPQYLFSASEGAQRFAWEKSLYDIF